MRGVKILGTVTEVGQSPIRDGGSGANQEGKDFKVVVRLEDPPVALRPGFTATAEITTATRSNLLVIPLQAQTAREVEIDAESRYVPPPEPIDDSLVTPVSAANRSTSKRLPEASAKSPVAVRRRSASPSLIAAATAICRKS